MKKALIFCGAVALSFQFSSAFADSRPSVGGNAAAIADLQDAVEALQITVENQQDILDAVASNINRAWTNVSSARTFSVQYQNTTGGDIVVAVRVNQNGGSEGQDTLTMQVRDPLTSSWVSVAHAKVSRRFNEQADSLMAIVPDGYLYRLVRSQNRAKLISWAELRS
ncbi:hypothetical protein SG34_018955 [Thalassomonas viridans]|uniref:Uncharacterized protein n=1 Tax=Thalassomonas viridans TaxID=137584 RepID=A0AAE9YYP8_9GAMM|nr:hypothetical protein [Thalassomonas viridans]WDE03460.1 hypothetical protein SG34_018955 [Thalassomonas viridans]